MSAYVAALCREIEATGERWSSLHVPSVYVGGGTPTLLPPRLLGDVIDVIRATLDLSASPEITIEANPGTVDRRYLSGARAVGVNRLSIGAQSACDEELRLLGRIHDWDDVIRAVEAARASGFGNLSLDLLFGLPRQSLNRWTENLQRALELEPEHLSLYGLSIEDGTPLAGRIARGELAALDDDRVATMYERAEAILAGAGYFHYEISNWAALDPPLWPSGHRWWPGDDALSLPPAASEAISSYVCRHNLTYWRNEPWLGVGAGSHSWMPADALSIASGRPHDKTEGERWANLDHPCDYIAARGEAAYPDSLRANVESIGRDLEMGETMMLNLRLAEGVTAEQFGARFGRSLSSVFGKELTDLQQLGLVAWDGEVARLTERGRLLGNRVFECFI